MEKRTVEMLYDWYAPIYDLWAELFETKARRRAEQLLEVQPGETLLEVAIGTGKQFMRLAISSGPKFSVGLDLSSGMISRAHRRVARKLRKQIALCRGDAIQLPFCDRVFDIVVNCYMLDLLQKAEIPLALAEFRRVLKLNGRLVVIAMAEQNPFFNKLWMRTYHLAPALVGGCRPICAATWIAKCGWHLQAHENVSQSGFRSELVVASPSDPYGLASTLLASAHK